MFIYVAALAVMFLCQSGVTGFIQAPAKAPRATTKATWGAPRVTACGVWRAGARTRRPRARTWGVAARLVD